jgi:hypothetical protein
MRCPECGHNGPNGRSECIYCGAALGESPFAEYPDSLKKGHVTRFFRQAGKDGTVYEVIEEHKEYNSPYDVPVDRRKKREEAIQRGDGDIAPDYSIQEQEIFSVLSHQKTPRRKRLHPLILVLIFFASAGIVGIVLWLLM